MYVAIANYFRTFTNFRVLNCVMTTNLQLYFGVYSSPYQCFVDPPLNSTSAKLLSSFYGVDLISTYEYGIDLRTSAIAPVSTSQIDCEFTYAYNGGSCFVNKIYLLVVIYV